MKFIYINNSLFIKKIDHKSETQSLKHIHCAQTNIKIKDYSNGKELQ